MTVFPQKFVPSVIKGPEDTIVYSGLVVPTEAIVVMLYLFIILIIKCKISFKISI